MIASSLGNQLTNSFTLQVQVKWSKMICKRKEPTVKQLWKLN